MHIIRTESSASFYESFSDLIFCTLVLFILLFLALAISVDKQVTAENEPHEQQPVGPVVDVTALQQQLQQAEQERDRLKIRLSVINTPDFQQMEQELQQQQNELTVQSQQLRQLLGSNRFVGRSGRSVLNLAVNVAAAGHWKYVPYPEQLDQDFSVSRNGETPAAAELRRMVARTEFRSLARRSRQYTAVELEHILIDGVQRYQEDDQAKSVVVQMAGGFSSVFSGARNIKGEVADERLLRKHLSVDVFQEFGNRTDNDIPQGTLPVLQFQLTGEPHHRLSCGGVRLTTDDAVHLLNAFSGRGVAVEVQPEAPDWFLEDVLTPTGYINRAPAATIEDQLPP
ncbi:MAG: hypothetical protein NXI04_19270 [Planctomycetaceae bacterium]|nr:hypothetical protein [Planctomycetaceae bacterium]